MNALNHAAVVNLNMAFRQCKFSQAVSNGRFARASAERTALTTVAHLKYDNEVK